MIFKKDFCHCGLSSKQFSLKVLDLLKHRNVWGVYVYRTPHNKIFNHCISNIIIPDTVYNGNYKNIKKNYYTTVIFQYDNHNDNIINDIYYDIRSLIVK